MVGVAYQTAMSALEGAAKMTGGLVLLDGLSVATAKNEEIKDILTQINIKLAAMTVFKAPSCGWSWPHSIQLYRSIC